MRNATKYYLTSEGETLLSNLPPTPEAYSYGIAFTNDYLRVLHDHPGSTLSDLSRFFKVKSFPKSQLKGMEELGLIRKEVQV